MGARMRREQAMANGTIDLTWITLHWYDWAVLAVAGAFVALVGLSYLFHWIAEGHEYGD